MVDQPVQRTLPRPLNLHGSCRHDDARRGVCAPQFCSGTCRIQSCSGTCRIEVAQGREVRRVTPECFLKVGHQEKIQLAEIPSDPSERKRLDRDVVQRTVIAIVSRNRHVREDEIGPDTDLVIDLGIAGDDIDPILLELIKTYPIDFSEANLSSHFGREGLWPWEVPVVIYGTVKYAIQRWIFGKSPREIGPGATSS